LIGDLRTLGARNENPHPAFGLAGQQRGIARAPAIRLLHNLGLGEVS